MSLILRFSYKLIIGTIVALGLVAGSALVASAQPDLTDPGSEPFLGDQSGIPAPTPGPVYTLTVMIGTTAGAAGSVTSPEGINCPGTCSMVRSSGTAVTLTAATSAGLFNSWSGDCAGSGSCTVVMTANKTVIANFGPNLEVVSSGSGAVASFPAGISCGSTCAAAYPPGSPVTLTATPNPGFIFWGWTGDCSGTGGCTVTTDGMKHVAAWFGDNVATQVLAISIPAGWFNPPGEISSSPPGIGCLNDTFHGNMGCFAIFPKNSIITLTAYPLAGQYFVGWNGDGAGCGPNPNGCQIIMDQNRFVGGSFAAIPRHSLSVLLPASGFVAPGYVSSSPAGISCNNDYFSGLLGCTAIFPQFSTATYPYPTTVVTLTAGPLSGNFFVGWNGDCSGFGANPTCTVTMDTNRFTGGSFAKQSILTVNVHKNPNFANGGSVSIGAPINTTCTAEGSCSYTLNLVSGTTILLTPSLDPGSTFTWGQACGGSGFICIANLNGNTYTADIYFIPHLVMNVHGSGNVTMDPPGSPNIAVCPADTTCVHSYPNGQTVFLTANPGSGQTFVWGQACGGSSSCSVVMADGVTTTVDIYFSPSGPTVRAVPIRSLLPFVTRTRI